MTRRPVRVTRKHFLRSALLGGTGMSMLGFVGACGTRGVQGGTTAQPETRNLVYSFNNAGGTVSVVDTTTDELIKTVETMAKAKFPSNQYGPQHGIVLAEDPAGGFPPDVGGVAGRNGVVSIFDQREDRVVGNIRMPHATDIWQEVTPDGKVGVIVKRPPDVVIFVNTDRDSENFGGVIGEVPVPNSPGLCDMTISPDGGYAYVPDVHANQVRTIDVQNQETVSLVDDPTEDPTFMGTASWDGRWLFIENSGDPGAETIYDLSDPANPEHVKTLAEEQGLGRGPYTSEFAPDSKTGFVMCRDSSDVSVVDIENDFEVVKNISLGDEDEAGIVGGAFNADGSKFYVNMREKDKLAIIDVESLEVMGEVSVGEGPEGVTGGGYDWVQPAQATFSLNGMLGSLGLDGLAEKLG